MSFEEKYRVVKRESADGSVQVVETINADYALIVDGAVEAIYDHLSNAYAAFGRLTRK